MHLKRDHLSSHRDSEELKPKTSCYLGCMPLNTKQRQLQVHPQKPFTTFALDRSCWSKTLSVIAQVKVNCDCVLAFTLSLCPFVALAKFGACQEWYQKYWQQHCFLSDTQPAHPAWNRLVFTSNSITCQHRNLDEDAAAVEKRWYVRKKTGDEKAYWVRFKHQWSWGFAEVKVYTSNGQCIKHNHSFKLGQMQITERRKVVLDSVIVGAIIW